MLLQSPFLVFVGALFLVLAKRYWFSIPLVGVGISLVLYAVGSALAVV